MSMIANFTLTLVSIVHFILICFKFMSNYIFPQDTTIEMTLNRIGRVWYSYVVSILIVAGYIWVARSLREHYHS